jgi:hypothetical protein
MGKNQHVVKREDGWAVRGEGNSRDTAHYPTQQEAIDRARDISQREQSELLIHGRDGRIRARDSHGHDPFHRAIRTRAGRVSGRIAGTPFARVALVRVTGR